MHSVWEEEVNNLFGWWHMTIKNQELTGERVIKCNFKGERKPKCERGSWVGGGGVNEYTRITNDDSHKTQSKQTKQKVATTTT